MLGLTRPDDGLEVTSGNAGYSNAVQAVSVFGGAFDFATLADYPHFVDYIGVPCEQGRPR
jgi:hypothetical protein